MELEHIYVETNGIKLHTVQAGAKDGEVVILLHGFPEFWYGWKHQIEFLAQQGYRVIAPDQRGYNLSDKPKDILAYRVQHLVDDLIGLVASTGREKVYLVAHDWGGVVAWVAAAQYPEHFKKLVILNIPHPLVFAKHVRSSFQQMRKSWYMAFFQLPKLPEAALLRGGGEGAAKLLRDSSVKPDAFSDEDIAHYKQAWLQEGAMTGMLNWYRTLSRAPSAITGKRSEQGSKGLRIRIPTLIIWGTQDIALGAELAQPSADMCDDARLVTFDDAGHWIAHEKPHEVNQLLAEFLQ